MANCQKRGTKFTQRYWDEKVQHEIRRKLKFGHHQPERNTSRAEYAISLYAEAIELNPPMTAIEIIQKLSRHFNEEVKYAIIGRGISRVEELIDPLENFDKIGPSNSGRGENREWKVRRINEQQDNRSENNADPRPSWKTHSGGSNAVRSDPPVRPSWHSYLNNSGNRGNTRHGQHRHQGPGIQSRTDENENWRGSNQQPSYRMKNIQLEEEESEKRREEEEEEEEEQTLCDVGNEKVPRL